MGEYRASLESAERFVMIAESGLDRFIGDRMLSMTLFCMGDFRGSRHHADLMLAHDVSAETNSSTSLRFRFGQSVSARIQPAQLLCLQGFPDQAVNAVGTAVQAARSSGHAISLCEALARWSCPVFVHVGDLAAADSAVTELFDVATANLLGPWEVFSRCWKAALLIERGLHERGVPLLRNGLAELRQVKLFNLYKVRFQGYLAGGLSSLGQHVEARSLIGGAISESEATGELWCAAELYRLKGDVLWRGRDELDSIERCYRYSLELARRQDALSWELRATTSLARLTRDRGNAAQGRAMLAAVCDRFTEGFETADMLAAKGLLAEMT